MENNQDIKNTINSSEISEPNNNLISYNIKDENSFILKDNLFEITTQRKYIDESKIENKLKIAIASFPRSGNTMLRTLFENLTGVYTGDDMIFQYEPKEEEGLLSYFGLGKENTIKNTLFVKTHYPNMNFSKSEFKANGVIFIARNPFDSFDSYFNFSRTNSHYLKINDEERQKLKEEYEIFITYLSKTLKEYNENWLSLFIKKVPTYFIKYEDFISEKKEGIINIFNFIFKFKPHPDYLNNRSQEEINTVINNNRCLDLETYKPGNGGKQNYITLLKNYFNKSQIKLIIEENYDYLEFFGYLEDFKKLDYIFINEVIEEVQTNKKDWKQKYGLDGAQNYKDVNNIYNLYFQDNESINDKELVINDNSKDFVNHYHQIQNYWNMETLITNNNS